MLFSAFHPFGSDEIWLVTDLLAAAVDWLFLRTQTRGQVMYDFSGHPVGNTPDVRSTAKSSA